MGCGASMEKKGAPATPSAFVPHQPPHAASLPAPDGTSSLPAPDGTSSLTYKEFRNQFKHDVFLSHDWGVDGNNHGRVVKMSKFLDKNGVRTWLDADEMSGDIMDKMCKGIEGSAMFVACVTERYVAKVRSDDNSDNCRREFKYGIQQKKCMVPIVMEKAMRDTSKWSGPVAMMAGGELYQTLIVGDDGTDSGAEFERQCRGILAYIEARLISLYKDSVPRASTAETVGQLGLVPPSEQAPAGSGGAIKMKRGAVGAGWAADGFASESGEAATKAVAESALREGSVQEGIQRLRNMQQEGLVKLTSAGSQRLRDMQQGSLVKVTSKHVETVVNHVGSSLDKLLK